MPNDLNATALALGQATGRCEPSSRLHREMGLAAVASGLQLQLNTLDRDVAEAVERGAAALFLAGHGPSLTRFPPSVRARENGNGRKARPVASQARQSQRFSAEKVEVVKCLAEATEAKR
jgi:hypothetical protein